ncbi:glycosyltransferase [Mesorhizobium sp. M1329]|uniref:glycosyltransferase n=1 Tax=Mesorhizobium sp. M1329 TaxID=2957083 RepID=UPI003336CACF
MTIEPMACGTPVIAFRRGAVPEVIDNGVSGLIVANRARVRETFEKRFLVGRMHSD